jgi:hypothetical protein
VVVLVAAITEHHQVGRVLESEPIVAPMMHLELAAMPAQFADMSCPLERERSLTLPVLRLEIFAIRHPTERGNRRLHVAINFVRRQADRSQRHLIESRRHLVRKFVPSLIDRYG